jgi:hypothetical protein
MKIMERYLKVGQEGQLLSADSLKNLLNWLRIILEIRLVKP